MSDSEGNQEPEHDEDGLTRIISYLDGELDDTQMNEVEQELIQDSELRNNADALSKTWALLDSLEEVSSSRNFSQETLATVAVETQAAPPEQMPNRLRRAVHAVVGYRLIPFFLLGLIGGAAGLTLSKAFWNKRSADAQSVSNRIVLDHYEMLQNVELYRIAPDAEKFQALKSNAPSAEEQP